MDIEYHRTLALQRLEGRFPIEDPTPEWVREWVQEQGLQYFNFGQKRGRETLPDAFATQPPLRRTRGHLDLRRAALDQESVQMFRDHESVGYVFRGCSTLCLPPPVAHLPADLRLQSIPRNKDSNFDGFREDGWALNEDKSSFSAKRKPKGCGFIQRLLGRFVSRRGH